MCYTYIYVYMRGQKEREREIDRFIIKSGLQDYGSWLVPRSAGGVSKLETQESWWYSSGLSLKSWEQKEQMVYFASGGWHTPYREDSVSIQSRQEECYSYLVESQPYSIVLFRPSTDWTGPRMLEPFALLSVQAPMLLSSKTPSQSTQIFTQISEYSVAQSRCHKKKWIITIALYYFHPIQE